MCFFQRIWLAVRLLLQRDQPGAIQDRVSGVVDHHIDLISAEPASVAQPIRPAGCRFPRATEPDGQPDSDAAQDTGRPARFAHSQSHGSAPRPCKSPAAGA